METNQTQQAASPNGIMPLEVFKKSLNMITPMEALQNFKVLLDKSVSAGMFKSTENVIIMYTSLDVLYSGIKTEPTLKQPDQVN